jgi:hypothetical protein
VSATISMCATTQDLLTIRSLAIGTMLLWYPRYDLYSHEQLVNTHRFVYDHEEQRGAIKSQDDLPLSNLKSQFIEFMQDTMTPMPHGYNTMQLFNQDEDKCGNCSSEDESVTPALVPRYFSDSDSSTDYRRLASLIWMA